MCGGGEKYYDMFFTLFFFCKNILFDNFNKSYIYKKKVTLSQSPVRQFATEYSFCLRALSPSTFLDCF